MEYFPWPSVADVERRHILDTLRHCDGNRTRAAKLLGISIRGLRNKLRAVRQTRICCSEVERLQPVR